jgi:hypothetical protein
MNITLLTDRVNSSTKNVDVVWVQEELEAGKILACNVSQARGKMLQTYGCPLLGVPGADTLARYFV